MRPTPFVVCDKAISADQQEEQGWNRVGSLRQSLRGRAGEVRLRRGLRQEFAELGIEGPTPMAEVCRRLSSRRDRPIRLLHYQLDVPGPFGLWLAAASADYVLVQAETTPLHQEHIIAHELGHVLRNHRSDERDDAALQELMPDIRPEVIRRALRRTSYDTEQEWEAETVATILLEAAAVGESVILRGHSARARRAQQALGDRQDWL
jgi:hypothetical protein